MLCIYNIYKYQQQQQQKNWKLESSTGDIRGRICSLYNFNVPISGLKFKKMLFFLYYKKCRDFLSYYYMYTQVCIQKVGFSNET